MSERRPEVSQPTLRDRIIAGLHGDILSLPNTKCELCDQSAECRPYGPGGLSICYECGMSPDLIREVTKNFERVLNDMLSEQPAE